MHSNCRTCHTSCQWFTSHSMESDHLQHQCCLPLTCFYLLPLLARRHNEPRNEVIDHDPSNAIICSIGYMCNLLLPTAWMSKLYPVTPAGVDECCAEGLPYVNPSYCRAKTMGIVSRKWFADYVEGICVGVAAPRRSWEGWRPLPFFRCFLPQSISNQSVSFPSPPSRSIKIARWAPGRAAPL